MRIRIPLLVSLVLLAAMLAVSAWGWQIVPAGARITTHWSLAGRPNGSMPRDVGLLILPAVAAVMSALFALVPAIEPRRQNLIASRKLYLSVWIGGLMVAAIAHVLIVMTAAGMKVNVPQIALLAAAALTVVIGNFQGKSRSTFLLGMRLPWTLSSEYAWKKSTRLYGWLMVATGLATVPALLLLGLTAGFAVFASGMVSATLAGAIASYVYWRHDPDRQTGDILQD